MPRSSPTLQVVRPGARSRTSASKPRASASTGADGGTSTQRIVESITTAIVERRLMPGTKLAEQKIADIFKVSRTLVRQALNQLSRDHLVVLEPARGALRGRRPASMKRARCSPCAQMLEVQPWSAAACAPSITDAQVAELRSPSAARSRRPWPAPMPTPTCPAAPGCWPTFTSGMAHHRSATQVLAQLLGDLLTPLVADRADVPERRCLPGSRRPSTWPSSMRIVAARCRGRRAADGKTTCSSVEHNLQLDPRIPDLAAALMPAPEPTPPPRTPADEPDPDSRELTGLCQLPARPARPRPRHAARPLAEAARASRCSSCSTTKKAARTTRCTATPTSETFLSETGHRAGLREPAHDDGVDVRVRLARRRVAHPARVRVARPAAHGVRRRHGAAALPELVPKPSWSWATRSPATAGAGSTTSNLQRGHRAPPARATSACRRMLKQLTGGAWPLGWYTGRDSPEHAAPGGRPGRLRVRQRLLRRRPAVLAEREEDRRQPGRRTWWCPTRWTPTTCASCCRRASATGDHFFTYLRDSFDVLYAEGRPRRRLTGRR